MTNEETVNELANEAMPAPLLAGLFSSGIVVFAGEFETAVTPANTTAAPVAQDAPATETSAQTAPAAGLAWLGNFARQVLVVVNDPTARHINEADFELLGKILGSVKLSIADIALVNAAASQLEYFSLNAQLQARVALYFGIQPVDIGAPLKFPMFQVQNWNNTTFIYGPALAEINAATPAAVSLKKELWAALKKVFG